ncbi:hypothetical protein DDE05_59765 [Streptomyces cavourensis]|nr:hypothetical protein DDE05_59765 [Streptomyces cavourensis]
MEINPVSSSAGRAYAASTAGQSQSEIEASEVSGSPAPMYKHIIIIKSQEHRDTPAVQGGEGGNGHKEKKPRFANDCTGIMRCLPDVWNRYGLEREPTKPGGAFFDVDNFIEKIGNSPYTQRHGNSIDLKFLKELVKADDRHEFSEDGKLVRATYGHAEGVRDFSLDTDPVTPPAVLYHGTVVDNLDSIMKEGLRGMVRGDVNLTSDKRVARDTAKRHDRGDPSKHRLLEVSALALHEESQGLHKFYNIKKVWQTKSVPPHHIKVVDWDDGKKTA